MIKSWKPHGRKGVRYFLIFAWIFGLLFFGIGVGFAVHSVRLLAGSERHFGRVVRHEVTSDEKGSCFHPIVQVLEKPGLVQSNAEIWSAVCSQSPDEEMGDIVPVLIPYNGDEPEVATFGDLWIFPIVFGGIGLLWLLIGAIPVVMIWKGKKRLERLKSYGTRYEISTFTLVRNDFLNFNGQNPYRMECDLAIGGANFHFRSHNLWIRDESEVEGPVNLYIDPRNPERYAFEVSYR